MCDFGCENWEQSDIPWYTHYRWSKDCAYFIACKSLPAVETQIQEGIDQVRIFQRK